MCVLYNVYESLDYNIYIEIVYLLFLMIFFKVYSKDFYYIIFFLVIEIWLWWVGYWFGCYVGGVIVGEDCELVFVWFL